MMTKRVFLDYAATAPLLPQVRTLLSDPAIFDLGNASSLYREGKLARLSLEKAREELAAVLSCSPLELYFCSGGSEAAGTLVEGIARGSVERSGKNQARMHIICAAFEHPAILNSVLSLKRLGFEVELIRPDREGRVTPESLEVALRTDTLMAVIMLAQNELGTVQDIGRLSQLTHEAGALFVSDCVQGFCKLPIHLGQRVRAVRAGSEKRDGAPAATPAAAPDAACFSSHKIGGPYGVGAFYLHRSVPFLPRQLGGGQERKLRSGTQNVPGALGFALAASLSLAELEAGEAARLVALRDDLLLNLAQSSSRIRSTVRIVAGDTTTHLPGHLHLLMQGIESQTMILKLDELGFAVSGGAACSSNSLEPSHVLTSLGLSKVETWGALRITLGRITTSEDCARFTEALLSIL